MTFTETPIPGAFLIELKPREDERGTFVRTFDAEEFRARGLEPKVAQCSVSVNHRAGTLRGMHLQAAPYEEVKLVRCSRGAIYDVLVDLRPDSDAYCRWHAVELGSKDHAALYVPGGVAHGFQTLLDDSEVSYQMSVCYAPTHSTGVRWNDRAFAIRWPDAEPRILSEGDRGWPDFNPAQPGSIDR